MSCGCNPGSTTKGINCGTDTKCSAKACVYKYSNNFPVSVPSGTLAYSRGDCKLYIKDNCDDGTCGDENGWVEIGSASYIRALEDRISQLENFLEKRYNDE